MTELTCQGYTEADVTKVIIPFLLDDSNFESQEAGIGPYEYWGSKGYDKGKTWEYIGPVEFSINAPGHPLEDEPGGERYEKWEHRETIVAQDKFGETYCFYPVETNGKHLYKLGV